MDGFTVTGAQVLAVLAVLLVVVLVAAAGRMLLLAAAVIAGIQWVAITYWPQNTTFVWFVLGVPSLLAGVCRPPTTLPARYTAR